MPKPRQETQCCPPPPKNEGKGLRVMDADRELAALAKALGHPARVRILRHVLQSKACICGDIVSAVGLAQATVSQHLKVLKQAGIIGGEIKGPATCYCVLPAAIKRLKGLLDGIA
jgi:ArsR family transcriptional regulator, arsenate/arsenite/antimonite-responsive transcriptional repressor